MGGGAFEPKSLVGVSKKAFTLAEVLITLAIIGVVAALTIPTVVAKYQQKAYYTAFMKTYNTFQNAIQLSIAQNGDPSTWGSVSDSEDEAFKKYIGAYLKVSKYCTQSPEDCGVKEDMLLNSLNFHSDEYGDETYSSWIEDAYTSAILQDGSLVVAWYELLPEYNPHGGMNFIVDTNGASKGPNVWGRDLFSFSIDKETPTEEYLLYPKGLYKCEETCSYSTLDDIKGLNGGSSYYDVCSTEIDSSGEACGARLILEGAMKY